MGPEPLYVYGITRAGAAVPVAESEPDLEAVQADGLQAICGPVPEGDLASGNPAALASVLRRHDAVVRQIFSETAVLPVRFGTVLLDAEQGRALLQAHHDQLAQQLDRIEGSAEWGVRITSREEEFLAYVERVSEELRLIDAEMQAASPGKGYMLRRKRDALLRSEVVRLRSLVVSSCMDSLAQAATECREMAAKTSGDEAEAEATLISLAFLVPIEGTQAFEGALEELAAANAPLGLTFVVSGPWPPYSFVDLNLTHIGPDP